MRIEQRFALKAAPEEAWPAFKDIELLVACLPGASLTGPPSEGEVPLRFDVRLGPIAASFGGSGRVLFDDAKRSGRFEGSATDRRTSSRVKGAADFALAPAPEGSSVEVYVDYALTGTLAQFSRGGIVKELASVLTTQFATNLESRIAASLSTRTDDAIEAAQPAAAQPQADARNGITQASAASSHTPPLAAGSLLFAALKARWRRIVSRLFGRNPA